MSCLIIKNDGIGDLILASGLIKSAGDFFDGELDLVTCSDNHEIAEGIESVREHFYVSRDGMHFSSIAQKFGLLIPSAPQEDQAVLRALAARRYDTVICLRRYIRQSTLVIMSKVRARRKFCAWEFPTNATLSMAKRTSKGWMNYSDATHVLSELTYNTSFLEHVLGAGIISSPQLSFCHMQTVMPSTRTVALGLGGGSTNWPRESWIELAMQLAAEGWKLVLLGGGDVSELATQIVVKVPGTKNLVGQLTWHHTADLLRDCEGYIGNDTGLSHFASLIVQKCLVILGGGTFRRFFPWPHAENQHVIYHGLDCFDCSWTCRHKERLCLDLVSPKDVYKRFGKFMAQGPSKQSETDLNPVNEQYQSCASIRSGNTSKRFVRH